MWDGTIQSRAGEVNFGIDIQRQPGGTLQATLDNASDRQPFSSAEWNENDGTLTLRMDYYDGVMTLHLIAPSASETASTNEVNKRLQADWNRRLEGEYSRLTSKGVVHIPVTMRPATGWGHAGTPPSLAGDWIFTWPQEKGAEKTTRASFQQDNGWGITGTIEPVSGDTGLLHGFVSWVAEGKAHFHLSRFDGIHVLAIDGEFQPDGSLKGEQGGIKSLDDVYRGTCQRLENRQSQCAGRDSDPRQRSAGAVPLQRSRCFRKNAQPGQSRIQRQAADRRYLRYLVSQLS